MAGTLQFVFRYRPGHRPDIGRLVGAVQQLFSANGLEITCSGGSDAALSSPLLESVSVNECTLAPIGDHRRLFDLGGTISSPDQIVIFVVRRIVDGGLFSGCAAHPPNIPGVVLTEAAAEGTITANGCWVLAHELGHVLGLSHAPASGSLMCDPATSISATMPVLSMSERLDVMNSKCIGPSFGTGIPRLALSELPSRATPERTIVDRELPILRRSRPTLLDDLD